MDYDFYLFTATGATQGHIKEREKALCCFLKENSDSVNVDIILKESSISHG